jgi:hypothetical protein
MTIRPAYAPSSPSGRWGWARERAGRLAAGAITLVRNRAAPVAGHLRDHFYSIVGLGLIAAAAFVHSTFTGLLVTGILFLVFEWKVSDSDGS